LLKDYLHTARVFSSVSHTGILEDLADLGGTEIGNHKPIMQQNPGCTDNEQTPVHLRKQLREYRWVYRFRRLSYVHLCAGSTFLH